MNDQFRNLESAVRDIMMKNQNLRQQDQIAKFQQMNQQTPAEVEAGVQDNLVDTPDPTPESEMVDPETVIPGSSGVEIDGQEE
jgi:TolA-binding protein